MKLTVDQIERARSRGPHESNHAGAYVSGALQEDELLGFDSGAPLADRPYSEYVGEEDLYGDPETAKEFLGELVDSPLVNSSTALARECQLDEETAAEVVKLYGLDLPLDGFNVPTTQKPEYAIVMPDGTEIPLEYLPDDPVNDARLLHALIGKDGMNCEEVADFLSSELRRCRGGPNQPKKLWDVKPHEVENAARRAGIFPEKDREDNVEKRAEAHVTANSGIVIDASDID